MKTTNQHPEEEWREFQDERALLEMRLGAAKLLIRDIRLTLQTAIRDIDDLMEDLAA